MPVKAEVLYSSLGRKKRRKREKEGRESEARHARCRDTWSRLSYRGRRKGTEKEKENIQERKRSEEETKDVS